MVGTSTDPMQFSPNATTTRGMIVTILYRLEGSPDVSGSTNSFSDVSDGTWYADAVVWAANSGIISGYGDGLFGPSDTITREQMLTIVYNYCKWKGIDVSAGGDINISSYTDGSDVSGWAVPAMQWACGTGAIVGKANGQLDPKLDSTRAEVAAILDFLESIK